MIGAAALDLHYQPKVDVKAGAIVGVEALVRWLHPRLGFVSPDEFIPLAEKTGLIDRLTRWVLRTALDQGRRWHDAGMALEMSVNVSARDLQSPSFATDVIALVEQSGFPASHLTLEITESAIMVDPRSAKEKLETLSRAGVRFSIDDFGTGYSSLAYLKQLPASQLKIDKSFVIYMHDAGNAAIVRSTVELAHNLGLTVTAEGVEDEAAFKTLRQLNCDVIQGYWLSRPAPAQDIVAWMQDSRWKAPPAALA